MEFSKIGKRDVTFIKEMRVVKSNMPIGYLFDNRLLRFKEDSTFLLLYTNAAICEDF